MAIKPPDLLNRLPSVAELLDKPPIRALTERWNRSAVAGSVRTFLEELRTDFERRAAAMPSIRELAERAARYVVSRQHHSLGIAINATGQIVGPLWSSTPLAETALERMIAVGREYTVEPADATSQSFEELRRSLCRLTGAESAAVVHSYSGAIWLAIAALGANREVIVARANSGDDSLPKLAAAANVTVKEVGGASHTTRDEFAAAISTQTAIILTRNNDSHDNIGEPAELVFDSLVQLARERHIVVVDALSTAPLIDPPTGICRRLGRSAAVSLATGADLVILRGDALVGGPACGILLGRDELIQRVEAHPLFASCEIDPLRAAAVGATIACYEAPASANSPLPVWQCLNTSIENLRNRAERLALQLTHMEGVDAATAMEMRGAILPTPIGEGWPSYGVSLIPMNADVAGLQSRLQSAKIPIHGRVEGDRIILDLRTVLPRQDKLIVDSLLGTGVTNPKPDAGAADSTGA